MTTRAGRSEGFSLVELLVGIAVSGMVLAGLVTTFVISLKSAQQTAEQLNGSLSAQNVSAYLTADIQNIVGAPDLYPADTAPPCAGWVDDSGRNVALLRWRESDNASTPLVRQYAAAYRLVQAAGSYTSAAAAATRWQLVRDTCDTGSTGSWGPATRVVTAQDLAAPDGSNNPVVTYTTATGELAMRLSDGRGYAFTIRAYSRPLANVAAGAAYVPPGYVAPKYDPVTTAVQDQGGKPTSTPLNGKIDRIAITYPAALVVPPDCLDKAYWKLAGLPSGADWNNAQSVVEKDPANSNVLWAQFPEGSGAADTSTGGATVMFTPQAPCNATLNAFAATPATDGAAPLLVSVVADSVDTAGLPQKDDRMDFVFSENVVLDSAITTGSKTLTLTPKTGSTRDTLAVGGLSRSAFDLGTQDYFKNQNSGAARFSTSISRPAGAPKAVRVTLTSSCSLVSGSGGSCQFNTPSGGSAASFTMPVAAGIADSAGNAAVDAPTPAVKVF